MTQHRHQLRASALALLLATFASAALSQVDEAAMLRDVALVKSSSGIAPEVFSKLEAFRPAVAPALQGTLHRVVLKRVIMRDGKDAGTDHRTIEFLPNAPGYMFESSSNGPGNASTLLEYGPFVLVQTHTTKHLAQTFPHLDIDSTSVTKISDVTLPASFDASLTPRAVWQSVSESDTAVTSKNVLKSIDRSNFAIIKRTCATSERQAAATVSPALQGTAVFVTCQQPDRPGDELSLVYLEAYGVFLPVFQAFKLPPQNIPITNAYAVEKVDVDAPAPGVLTAAASAPGDAVTFEQATATFDAHDYTTAFSQFSALAQAGDARAQMKLSQLYYTGLGVAQDKRQTAAWARKAAEQGLAVAQLGLGTMYDAGTVIPQDKAAAFDWFMKAALQGNREAQQLVAIAYVAGSGVAKNTQLGFEWERKAAAQGLPEAEAGLGIMYRHGEGTSPDIAQAAAWIRKAAGHGDARGQSQLCILLASGLGMPRDNEEADVWCILAAAQGDEEAKLNRPNIDAVLTPEQRARAQQRAASWKPQP